jgi:hypothetical protein
MNQAIGDRAAIEFAVGFYDALGAGKGRELQLSGLVVKEGEKLRVYNPIYAAVFDEGWIDGELGKLCPYAENFRAWVASGKGG